MVREARALNAIEFMEGELDRPVATVGDAFERLLALGELPNEAGPIWERMILDIVGRDGERPALIVLHRDFLFDPDEDPENMGWTLRLAVDVRHAGTDGRPRSLPADADDAPERSLDEFARAARALLDEQGLLDVTPVSAHAFV